MLTYRNLFILPRNFSKFHSIIAQNKSSVIFARPHASIPQAKSQSQKQNVICHTHISLPLMLRSPPYRCLTQSTVHCDDGTKATKSKKSSDEEGDTLNEYQAYDMIYKLSDNDRASLSKALNKYESEKIKSKFQGELASSKWRLRFGRRENVPALGAVDPTGSYCAMPDDWLQKKLAEAAVAPSRDALTRTFLVNAFPFIGFGFLDNFFMIIMGDYIESSIGVYMCISTMAAAALGNTISDVLGLGLANYVEQFCVWLGLKPPKLTPSQLSMAITQRAGSMGRVIGITIGCLLGMFPLLLMGKTTDEAKTDLVKAMAN